MSSRHHTYRILGLLAGLMTLASCQWRELDYDYIDTARFTLIYDWSRSSLRGNDPQTMAGTGGTVQPGDPINGRTAAFYPEDGSAPIIRMSHSDTMNVNLLVGKYRAVFFNETFDDFDNIRFYGTDYFDDLEAALKEDLSSGAGARAGNLIAREPDILAVETMIPFEVTEEMVLYTRAMETRNTKSLSDMMGAAAMKKVEESLTVTARPRDVVYPVSVDVVVYGMDNIASAGAYITGFSGGFDFSTGRSAKSSVTHKVTFSERKYDPGSTTDGTMRGTFTSFGLRNELGSSRAGDDDTRAELTDYTFEFRAVLINGEVFTEIRSINNLITEVNQDGRLTITIEVGQNLSGTDVDPPIKIPDVEPVGSEDGMWQVNVGDWEEVVVPIGF